MGEDSMRRWLVPIIAALMFLSGQTVLAAQPQQGVVRDLAAAIYTVSPNGGGKTLWRADPQLQPHGSPPFGANGVAFDRTQSWLYVANTADDKIFRIRVSDDPTERTIQLFADGATLGPGALDGADGIEFDVRGNLYVCANQANEIQVLSPSGASTRSEEHTSELQSPVHLVCRLLLEKKK